MKRVLRFTFVFAVVLALLCWQHRAHSATPAESDHAPGLLVSPDPIMILHPDGSVSPPPISAIAVSQCGLAVALFIQLDSNHLFRADPRQSDLFTNVNGQMRQTSGGPMQWKDALELARSAVLTTHVTIPCTDGPRV